MNLPSCCLGNSAWNIETRGPWQNSKGRKQRAAATDGELQLALLIPNSRTLPSFHPNDEATSQNSRRRLFSSPVVNIISIEIQLVPISSLSAAAEIRPSNTQRLQPFDSVAEILIDEGDHPPVKLQMEDLTEPRLTTSAASALFNCDRLTEGSIKTMNNNRIDSFPPLGRTSIWSFRATN